MRVDHDLPIAAVLRCDRFDVSAPAPDLYVRPAVSLQSLPNLLAVHRLIALDKGSALARLHCCKSDADRSDD